MNLIDCHTHTQYSMDSEADIVQMIERARELNLSAYAVTDHCECNFWYEKEHYSAEEAVFAHDYFNYQQDFENSVTAVNRLKEKYPDFNLVCGVEMGQAMLDIEVAEKITSDPRLDFVIASVHQIKNEHDFYYIDYSNMTMDEIYNLLERYFTEVYNLCKWGKFDVLGHITYCIRYMRMRHGIKPDLKRFDEIIAESFRELARNGKGIEINTSGIRQGLGFPFPSLKYISLFRDMGGEVISVGSDAHVVEDLGADLLQCTELAKTAGFRHICYFKNRRPHFLDI
ncbi:MAG: histidinol-phosphatase HisJ family protein [Ruminococcus flavefaciens]|nr:histidinol-phosphatase HisJ family protein [Ruminococcus flavefaciens]MCM1230440.1 histidinol-phosphatase HisJ family protein [Ruminococcus flavefaciens]